VAQVTKNIRARLRSEDGAAAVEFALIVGVLVMLIFGMLQFGVAFFQLQNLRAATRVQQASYDAIPASSGAMSVTTCPIDAGQNDESTVAINIGSGSLPAALQDIFTVDIPLIPPITINTTVSGEFRCES
jgi:Flp pilus assembly pilin Flp